MHTPLLYRPDTAPTDGTWRKTLTVPPDHRALLYVHGEYRGTLGPGTHALDTRLARLNRLGEDNRVGAVILRDGPWPVALSLKALVAGIRVAARVHLLLAVTDPPLAVSELLGARPRLDSDDLRERLTLPLVRCLRPYTDDQHRLSTRIAADLGSRLGAWGLRLHVAPLVSLDTGPDQAARLAHRQRMDTLQRDQELDLTTLRYRLGREKLEAVFRREERVAEVVTDAEVGDIRRNQARADLALEAERERLWREKMAFLVELDKRWQ